MDKNQKNRRNDNKSGTHAKDNNGKDIKHDVKANSQKTDETTNESSKAADKKRTETHSK